MASTVIFLYYFTQRMLCDNFALVTQIVMRQRDVTRPDMTWYDRARLNATQHIAMHSLASYDKGETVRSCV